MGKNMKTLNGLCKDTNKEQIGKVNQREMNVGNTPEGGLGLLPLQRHRQGTVLQTRRVLNKHTVTSRTKHTHVPGFIPPTGRPPTSNHHILQPAIGARFLLRMSTTNIWLADPSGPSLSEDFSDSTPPLASHLECATQLSQGLVE